jgi:aminopeptidase N
MYDGIKFSSLLIAQPEYHAWIKQEQERYKKTVELSKIQYPGDSRIDVMYYGLNIKVTNSPQYISGSAIMNIKVNASSINSCSIDLSNVLKVDSVLLNRTKATFVHSKNIINIDLNKTYSKDGIFSLQIFYNGKPSDGLFFGTHNGGYPIIFTNSEPYGASYWYPCKDTPADKADSSDVWITVSDSLTPVSNGILEGIVNNGNGTHTYYWKNHYPIAQYLISLAISNYMQYNTYFHYGVNDSMIITHYIFPDPEFFNAIKEVLDETDDMIAVFSQRYGLYPFIKERYGHAQILGRGFMGIEGVAMEHQTCTSISALCLGMKSIIAHELAHQWYGDKITCRDWHHIWLNEGFATYSEAVYLEATDGVDSYNQDIQNRINSAKDAQGSIWVQDISNVDEIFSGTRSYAKGACVLHMLRGIVGDSTFFNIMKTYSNEPSIVYGSATTEDFQAVAENISGQDLDYFFQEWIYGENYPKYTVRWSKNNISKETYKVNLNINQIVNINPSFFTMPVRIKVYISSGDTIVTLFNNTQNQDFQFEVNGNPDSINFDYGDWILKDVLIVTAGVEEDSSPTKFSLDQNYPNPFNPTTTIAFHLPSSSFVTLKVYNSAGREVTCLVDRQMPAGNHRTAWNASGVPSGIYFYRIQAGAYSQTKKLVVMR